MHSQALLVLALAGCSVCMAQDGFQSIPLVNIEPAPLAGALEPQLSTLPTAVPLLPLVPLSPSAPLSPLIPYAPLTLGENYKYSFDRVFSPGKLLLFGIKAAMDQERDMPGKWGQGAEAYSERYADRFGRALVRENLGFAVRALDGEDPRYELSRDTGIWRRSKHAIARTFVTRGHNGELMPAYSRFVADFGMPFIAAQWEPYRFTPARAFSTGIGGIGFAVAANIGTEFWPDLRRKFLRR